MPETVTIPLASRGTNEKAARGAAGATTALHYHAAAETIGATLVLAHGAGAGHLSAFMVSYARNLSGMGVDVVTFNFPYTEARRRVPDRGPILESCYRSVIDVVREVIPSARHSIFIGGKSMGGRIATQVAAADRSLALTGLVLLGYPLHPPGRPSERRDAHLPSIGRPMLFVQGSRDSFGTTGELRSVLDSLQPPPVLHAVEGGDHSFKVSGGSPAAQAATHENIQRTIVDWIVSLTSTGRTA